MEVNDCEIRYNFETGPGPDLFLGATEMSDVFRRCCLCDRMVVISISIWNSFLNGSSDDHYFHDAMAEICFGFFHANLADHLRLPQLADLRYLPAT